MDNWLGSSLNQIQGWNTVRESYSRALEQVPLLFCFLNYLSIIARSFLHLGFRCDFGDPFLLCDDSIWAEGYPLFSLLSLTPP